FQSANRNDHRRCYLQWYSLTISLFARNIEPIFLCTVLRFRGRRKGEYPLRERYRSGRVDMCLCRHRDRSPPPTASIPNGASQVIDRGLIASVAQSDVAKTRADPLRIDLMTGQTDTTLGKRASSIGLRRPGAH